MGRKIIGHLDMDAFFASVEERDKPWLKGLPIVVGADPAGGMGRGVVSTANYKARTYGIRSALPISTAWKYGEIARKKGESAVAFIAPSPGKYSAESECIMRIIKHFTPVVEQTSIDEAFIDLSFCRSYKKARDTARALKNAIKYNRKLISSVGIGPNKMIAKMASDYEKPDGLMVVTTSAVASFLTSLSVRTIPGIGPKAEIILKRRGVRTIGELTDLPWQTLNTLLGSNGFDIYQRARGIADDTPHMHSKRDVHSIGENETFAKDILDLRFVMKEMSIIAANITDKMVRCGFGGFHTVVLTIRFEDFQTKTRSLTSKRILATSSDLELRALKLLLPFFEGVENPRKKYIRMIGVRIEKFV